MSSRPSTRSSRFLLQEVGGLKRFHVMLLFFENGHTYFQVSYFSASVGRSKSQRTSRVLVEHEPEVGK